MSETDEIIQQMKAELTALMEENIFGSAPQVDILASMHAAARARGFELVGLRIDDDGETFIADYAMPINTERINISADLVIPE